MRSVSNWNSNRPAGQPSSLSSGLVNFLQRTQAYFAQYRIGERLDFALAYTWDNLSIPNTAAQTIYDNRKLTALGRPLVQQRRNFVDLDTVLRATELQQDAQRQAWAALRDLKRSHEAFYTPKKYQYVKVIGWGGQGIVAKYDELDDDDNYVRSVAVKRVLDRASLPRLHREIALQRSLIGASHIVQMIDTKRPVITPNQTGPTSPPPDPKPPLPIGSKRPYDNSDEVMSDADLPPPKRTRIDPGLEDMLILEYSENGDLMNLIMRLNERKLDPNDQIGANLDAVARGCQELANPPVDDREDKSRRGEIVHFDLDPQNIFVDALRMDGQTDPLADAHATEHSYNPKLRIADFGLATFMGHEARTDYEYYNMLRARGKFGYLAPEQFTVEWDPIDPRADDMPHAICGNYQAHTNIWGIGLVMESLITLESPRRPPQAFDINAGRPDVFNTYGNHLLDDALFGRTDRTLREVVARCLAHDPAHRPTLDQLVDKCWTQSKIVDDNDLNHGDHEESDLHAWMLLALYDAPPSTLAGP